MLTSSSGVRAALLASAVVANSAIPSASMKAVSRTRRVGATDRAGFMR
jgi:hypothetical protein